MSLKNKLLFHSGLVLIGFVLIMFTNPHPSISGIIHVVLCALGMMLIVDLHEKKGGAK